MTKKEFLDLVAGAYPDTDVATPFYDEDGSVITGAETGDTLAEFVILECSDMYQKDDVISTLNDAVLAMDRARDDIECVADALRKKLEDIHDNAEGS